MSNPVDFDPFARFRSATRARIGLGRAGDAMPTQAVLEFQLAHAKARDAVHGEVDFEKLAAALAPIETVLVHSLAKDRATYLTRPDLGRMPDRHDLPAPGKTYEIAFIIADGLSAAAVERHAVPVYQAAVRLPAVSQLRRSCLENKLVSLLVMKPRRLSARKWLLS